jgi:plasmid stabilization system protein ParE
MRILRHPLVTRDIRGIAEHVLDISGDPAAARRRLHQIDDLLRSIGEAPTSGARLSGALAGWRVRFGGPDQRLSVVFRTDVEAGTIYIALVAFGGRDWMGLARARQL